MSKTHAALKERNLDLGECEIAGIGARYRALVAGSAITQLDNLQSEHSATYEKFPELAALHRRFQDPQPIQNVADAMMFLNEVSSLGNVVDLFLISARAQSVRDRYQLDWDEYGAAGHSALDFNKHLRTLFSREFEATREFSLETLASNVTSVAELQAIRQEAVSRKSERGIEVVMHLRNGENSIILEGVPLEDALYDEQNRSAKIENPTLEGHTLTCSASDAEFIARPFQGPFHDMAMTVLNSRK